MQYGELAAQRAMTVFAYGEAVRHLEQALEVQEVLDPDDKAQALRPARWRWRRDLVPAGEAEAALDMAADEAFAWPRRF